jgi:hypothetical protein
VTHIPRLVYSLILLFPGSSCVRMI